MVYFIRKIFGYLDRASHVVICVDKDSPAVKQIVCHGKRKEWRCVRCKPLEKAVYHQECEKECVKKEPLSHTSGPHLAENSDAQLPFLAQDWMRFATDSENLRRELYPRLVNALLCVTLPAGKYLYISGFPLQIKEVLEWAPNTTLHREKHVVIEPWSLPIPQNAPKEVFCHTMIIEGGVKRLVPAMYNEIQEADNGIFYYLSFFPEPYRQKVLINDGDAISIGLFLAQEYSLGPDARAHELFLMLPNRQGASPFEYVNLSLLYDAVGRTFEFEKAGVQNRVATLVFLIVLSGTDFFQDFCYGIGTKTKWNDNPDKREKQTKGVWDTFFDKADLFSHLVQFYRGAPSVRTERRIVLDEHLFERFVQECFISKYGKTIVKKRKTQSGEGDITFAQIRAHVKSKERQPPPDNVILRQCRQICWNLNYWINAWRNVNVDPFERHMDLPYYGYEPPGKLVDVVASKQKPVDEVCKRNFLKRKLKQKEEPPVVFSESKKRLALAAIKGDF